jgi:pimeloyl-ACP methyl ester carboxylesterase
MSALDENFPITRPSGRVLPGTLTRAPDPASASQVIILLHGMIADMNHNFAPALAAALATRARAHVLRFNFRGVAPDAAEPAHRFRICGFDDDVDDVAAALAALAAAGLAPAALVGHSRGAGVALRAAASLPGAAGLPLALLAPRFDTAAMLDGPLLKRAALEALAAGAESVTWATRAGAVLVTRDDVAYLRAAGTMAATVAALPAAARVLLVHGTDDKTIPVASAADFAAARPSIRVVIVQGARHNFDAAEHAAALIDAVVEHLA